MDKIIVKPLYEVGGVQFGMNREKVRKIFGVSKEFKKSKFSKNTADDFGFCHVFYNKNNECEAIEIFDGTEVFLDEQMIFPTNLENIKNIFGNLIEEDGNYISVNNSIGIYAPSGKIESILFGCKGYYK